MKKFSIALCSCILWATVAHAEEVALSNGQKMQLKEVKEANSIEKKGLLATPFSYKAAPFTNGKAEISIPFKVGGEVRYRIKALNISSAVADKNAAVTILNNAIPIKEGTGMLFNSNGQLSSFLIPADQKLVIIGAEFWAKASQSTWGADIYLTAEGTFNLFTLAKDFTGKVGSAQYTFSQDRIISFHANGNIAMGTIKAPMALKIGEIDVQVKGGPKADVTEMDGSLNFSKEGVIIKVFYEKPPTVTVDNQAIPLYPADSIYGKLSFTPETKYYNGIAATDVSLTLDGKNKAYKKGDLISFTLAKPAATTATTTVTTTTTQTTSTASTTSLNAVPASWDGDSVEENRPGKVALRIKNGKIYLVMGSSETETFPGTSTLKYQYSYSETECSQSAGSTVEYKWTRDPATGKIKSFNSGSVTVYIKK
jgi:hypothetical protein